MDAASDGRVVRERREGEGDCGFGEFAEGHGWCGEYGVASFFWLDEEAMGNLNLGWRVFARFEA